MDAAPAAIPPKPKIAAMIATTRKMIVQRNIGFVLDLIICFNAKAKGHHFDNVLLNAIGKK